VAILVAAAAAAVIGLGIVVGRRVASPHRERAWELEAAGCGLLALAWLAGIAS
jgi:hypothetical protein